ncbi:hypothetical protein AMTR_s00183p00018070 [Amborella trichopoda]|uniref:Uncharacterized protein n=1 Tax=Amborella trichopoda TaxID=13333 RepID=U5D8J7_AMBTC|nr:hypothetical protein AMTR_s00183p00018070 [Amborella trichopoda]
MVTRHHHESSWLELICNTSWTAARHRQESSLLEPTRIVAGHLHESNPLTPKHGSHKGVIKPPFGPKIFQSSGLAIRAEIKPSPSPTSIVTKPRSCPISRPAVKSSSRLKET